MHFQRETSLLSTPLTSRSIKRTLHHWLQEIIYSRDNDVMLGGDTHKSWYLRGAEALRFLKNQAKIKKVAQQEVLNRHFQ